MTGKCFVELTKLIDQIEQKYYVKTSHSGETLEGKDIVAVMTSSFGWVNSQSEQAILDTNRAAETIFIKLSYLKQVVMYHKLVLVNYTLYPSLSEVAAILLQFVRAESVTRGALKSVNQIISWLHTIDQDACDAKEALSYKMLRASLVLLCYKNYVGASILIELILSQFRAR